MADSFLLNNEQIIDLFEVKLGDLDGYFRFHGSKNLTRDVVFQGKTFLFIPCEISSVVYDSQGKHNRPTLSVSNVNKYISEIIRDRGDLVGRRFDRKKIFTRDLDDVNFQGSSRKTLPSKTYTGYLIHEKYIINKKISENRDTVEFSLSNVFDVDGLTVPARKVYNDSCQWQYRGKGCNYGKKLNYDGPSIKIVEGRNYSDFSNVCSELNIDINLALWLHPESSRTISNSVSYVNESGKNLVFNKLTQWSNSASSINSNNGGIILQPSNIVLNNVLSFNGTEQNDTGGLIAAGKAGAYFTVKGTKSPTNEYDTSSLSLSPVSGQSFNSGLTVFYVSALVNKLYSNNSLARRVLTSSTGETNDIALGYDNQQVNVISGFNGLKKQGIPFKKAINKLNLYSLSCQLASQRFSDPSLYSQNGFLYKVKKGFDVFPNFGINSKENEESECVVYEIIVFNKKLSAKEANAVSSYLQLKYDIEDAFSSTSNNASQFLNDNRFNFRDVKSKSFFLDEEGQLIPDGNMGVPVADDNDKTFTFRRDKGGYYNESYGLKNLRYRGDYSSEEYYEKGDFVKIDSQIDFDFNEAYNQKTDEIPSRFFVCIAASKDKNPLDFTSIWIEDRCSKKLSGCQIRFPPNDLPIPFGGFPGTVGYEYRLPGG
tara:strand:+ start:12826 stop:14787 length:1962 start_codon:yes stop_codon:yes gene_type:complete